MFMLAVIAPQDQFEGIRNKLNRHLASLQGTGLVTGAEYFEKEDALFLLDTSSPFCRVSEEDDQFRFIGGVLHPEGSTLESGEFAALTLDSTSKPASVVALMDSNGSWPLYFGANEGKAAVGNDPHAVAIALNLSTLSEEGVFEFINLQHALGRETTIEGVLRLWASERLEIPALAKHLQSNLTPEQTRSEFPPTRADNELEILVDTTFRTLVEGVPLAELEKRGVAVQVSGGLDSRLTAAAISRAGASDLNCVTLRLADDDEITVAQTVSERLGNSHTALTVSATGEADLKDAWLLTGGQVPVHAAAGNLPIYRMQLNSAPEARIVGAWPIDLLIGSYVPLFDEATDPSRLKIMTRFWTYKRTSNPFALRSLKRSNRLGVMNRAMRRKLLSELDDVGGTTMAHRITRWGHLRRTTIFTYISPARLCSNVLEITPVLAPEFINLLFSLTAEDIVGKNFYRKLIWDKLPELRDIPYHNTGKPITPEYAQTYPMSQPLQLLLKMPRPFFGFVERIQNKRIAAKSLSRPSEEVLHWDNYFQRNLPSTIKLTRNLTVSAGAIDNASLRVPVAAASLACLWTKEYLDSYVTK